MPHRVLNLKAMALIKRVDWRFNLLFLTAKWSDSRRLITEIAIPTVISRLTGHHTETLPVLEKDADRLLGTLSSLTWRQGAISAFAEEVTYTPFPTLSVSGTFVTDEAFTPRLGEAECKENEELDHEG